MDMNCIRSPRMATALEQLYHPQFRLARPSLLRLQGCRKNAELLLARGADANAETQSRLRAVRRARAHAACGSAGRLEPPVYGCHSGYQDAAEDLGDHEYGEDN